MTTPIRKNQFIKVFMGLAVLVTAFLYSCNESTETEVKTETVTPAPVDTMMQRSMDTMIIDTAGKGGQPAPPRN